MRCFREFGTADTVCIDKTSSAELSEAINSTFEWYEKAEVCYAYLVDVLSRDNDQKATMMQFHMSRWFTRGCVTICHIRSPLMNLTGCEIRFVLFGPYGRVTEWSLTGWTLQELLASKIVIFYDHDWMEIGTKSSLSKIVSTVTGITELDILDFKNANVAVKMSWASKRETTRIEDIAYCLMGLFGVNMPLLYGEGRDAFIRLQLEILKMSADETIFAWEYYRATDIGSFRYPDWAGAESGLLAPSPAYFRHSGDIRRILFDKDRPVYSMTNKGLQIGLLLLEQTQPVSPPTYLASLNCTRDSEGRPLVIFLRSDLENKDIPNAFIRYTSPNLKLTTMSATNAASILKIQRQTVYIKQSDLIRGSRQDSMRFQFIIKYPASFRVTPELFFAHSEFRHREELEYRECGITLSREGKQGILIFYTPHAENPQSFVMFLTESDGLVLTDVVSPERTQTLAETAHSFSRRLREINRIHRKDRTSTLLQNRSSVSVVVRSKGRLWYVKYPERTSRLSGYPIIGSGFAHDPPKPASEDHC